MRKFSTLELVLAISSAVLLIALIVVSVRFKRYDCAEDVELRNDLDSIITEYNHKIYKNDLQIINDSLTIWNSSRSERDSLRAARYLRYLHRDTLYR